MPTVATVTRRGTVDRRTLALLGVLVGLGLVLVAGGLWWYYVYRAPDSYVTLDPELSREAEALMSRSAAPSAPSAGDWPQWRGPLRDGISREPDLLTDWPANGLPELWRQPIGPGFSTVAVARGRLYTMEGTESNETVLCRDAETGREVWRQTYDRPGLSPNNYGPGPRSTPTVDGDRVYTVGSSGIFLCLDAATGRPHWRHDLLAEFNGRQPNWGVAFSPLVEGDLVYTMPGGPDGNALAAFHKVSGQLVWKNLNDRPGYSSPIAVNAAGVRQIVFFTAEALVGVTPGEGRELWRFPWTTSYDANISTPIAFADHLFISSGYGKGCALLRLLPAGDRLEVKPAYQHRRMKNQFSSSVLIDGHLYGFDEGRLLCMVAATGKEKWREDGFLRGSIVAIPGHLIVLGENAKLALVAADPERYVEKALARNAATGRCWTVPVVANGRLYVRDEAHLICFDLRKK
jgi:outer membrane protein assembly factor BamB